MFDFPEELARKHTFSGMDLATSEVNTLLKEHGAIALVECRLIDDGEVIDTDDGFLLLDRVWFIPSGDGDPRLPHGRVCILNSGGGS